MARGAHKINPISFRMGINKIWNSKWYAEGDKYIENYLSDIKVRKLVYTKLKQAGIADIVIKRLTGKTIVEIGVSKPGIVIGKGGASLQILKNEISKLLNQTADIKIFELKNPEAIAKIVAENIANQCERRINPKIAISKAAAAAMENKSVKGIEIWVAGRIKGAEIARRERVKLGSIPRHTLRADIDYAYSRAQVPALGIHSVKVWIYKGEKTSYSLD